MTTPSLQVTPGGLRALAQRCDTLSGQLAASSSPVAASGWQSSGTAVTAINAGATKAAMALKARMSTTGSKLTTAARDYENQDDQGRAALSRLDFNRAGADGGAGGLRASPSGPVTGNVGADGGAAAFGTPR